jgi:hypothetical protein
MRECGNAQVSFESFRHCDARSKSKGKSMESKGGAPQWPSKHESSYGIPAQASPGRRPPKAPGCSNSSSSKAGPRPSPQQQTHFSHFDSAHTHHTLTAVLRQRSDPLHQRPHRTFTTSTPGGAPDLHRHPMKSIK